MAETDVGVMTKKSMPKKFKKSLIHKGSVIVGPVVKLKYKEVIDRVVRRIIKDSYLRKSDKQADFENLRQDMFRFRHQVNKAPNKQNHKLVPIAETPTGKQ